MADGLHSPQSWFSRSCESGCQLWLCLPLPPPSPPSSSCHLGRPSWPLHQHPDSPAGSLSHPAETGPGLRHLPQPSPWCSVSSPWGEGVGKCIYIYEIYLVQRSYHRQKEALMFITHLHFTSGASVGRYNSYTLSFLPVELHEPQFQLQL